ncbi:MAG: hypothetical protein AAFR28_06300 [Pseudomonadota bacterium]
MTSLRGPRRGTEPRRIAAPRGVGVDAIERGGASLQAGLSELMQGVERREDRRAGLAFTKARSDARAHWAEELRRRREEQEGDPSGFAGEVRESYAQYSAQALEGLPERVRERANEWFSAYGTSLFDDAVAFESQRSVEWRVGQLSDVMKAAQNAILSRPGEYDELFAEVAEDIKAQGLPAKSERAMLDAWRNDATESRLSAQIMGGDFNAVISDLHGGKFDKLLDPNSKDRLLKSAQAAKKRAAAEARARQAQAQQRLRGEAADALAALAGGVDPSQVASAFPDFMDPKQRRAIFGTEQAAVISKRIADATERGKLLETFNGMSPDEGAEWLRASIEQRTDDAVDFRADAEQAQAYMTAYQASMEARAKDPAAWVEGTSDAMEGAREALEEGVEDAGDDYIDLQIAEQTGRGGFQPDEVRPLPKGDAIKRVADIIAMPTADAGPALAEFLGLFPRHREAVLDQLQAEGLPPRIAMAARVAGDPLATQAFARSAQVDHAELRKQTKAPELRDIDADIERELSGAREAFVAGKGPDAVNYWTSIQGAARDFALEHFAEHGDAGDAAQHGVEMAFSRHFEIADSNRVKAAVPRSSGATAEQVEYFASQAFSGRRLDMFVDELIRDAEAFQAKRIEDARKAGRAEPAPLFPDPVQRDIYRDTLRRDVQQGFWVDHSEPGFRGLVLMQRTGAGAAPVETADRRLIKRSYREIAESAGEPGRIYRNTGGWLGGRVLPGDQQ